VTGRLQRRRGAAIGLVAGVRTGVLVTGPGVRLIMPLLAVTRRRRPGADHRGDETVGGVDLGRTIGLIVFGMGVGSRDRAVTLKGDLGSSLVSTAHSPR